MSDCPFCDISEPLLADYGDAVVLEPLGARGSGHVLVVPRQHVVDVGEDPVVSGRVMEAAARYIQDAGIGPCNVSTNRGRAAGQTVMHLHVHIVPRKPPGRTKRKKGGR